MIDFTNLPKRAPLRFAGAAGQLLALIGCLSVAAFADTGRHDFDFVIRDRDPATATRAASLRQERAALELARERQASEELAYERRFKALDPGEVNRAMIEHAAVAAESLRIQVDDLNLRLVFTGKEIDDVQAEFADLSSKRQLLENPASEVVAGADRSAELLRLHTAIADQSELLEWYRARREITQERAEIAERSLKLALRWQSALRRAASELTGLRRGEIRSRLDQRTESEVAAHLLGAGTIRKQLLQPGLSEFERRLLETRAEVAEERAAVVRADGRIAEINRQLALISELLNAEQPTTAELQVAIRYVDELIVEIERGNEVFARRIALNRKRRALAETRTTLQAEEREAIAEELELLDTVRKELSSRGLQVEDILSRSRTLQLSLDGAYEDAVRQGLLTRRVLPETGTELLFLFGGVAQTPQLIANQVWFSLQIMFQELVDLPRSAWVQLIVLELVLLWVTIRLRRWLQRLKHVFSVLIRRRGRFGDRIMLVLLRLLYSLSIAAAIVLAMVILVESAGLQQPGRGILYTLLGIGLLARLSVRLFWLLMADPGLPAELRHRALYRMLRVLVWLGAVVVTLGMLARDIGVSERVQDVLDRLLMLFLFLTIVPALKARQVVLGLLEDAYGKQFWFASASLVSLVLVWSPVVIAVLGLLGYLDLAWRLLGGLTLFAAAIAVWLLLRGFLDDLIVALKNLAVAHSHFALLWTQDIIAPLHRVARIVLFLAVAYVLLWIYAGTAVGVFADNLLDSLQTGLFNVGSSTVTPGDILILLISLLVVIRLGQWTRSITYNWFYSRIGDLGTRNSLSAFTQYALVLIGLLIILNSVGIDLTTLTVFAGALGVGLGIGLQNVANNFVSGILLLVERPLKAGDWVQVAGGEGKVSSIGMRSLTVKTWDNQEVIIPNSEVISNSFTNWTRSDHIVRTVLYIAVSRDADPHKVCPLMQAVLDRHAYVLEEPPAECFLWQFGESSTDFRVQYYCNVILHNRLRVQSDVLFGIWDTLSQNGIEIPYPQRDLHFRPVRTEQAGVGEDDR